MMCTSTKSAGSHTDCRGRCGMVAATKRQPPPETHQSTASLFSPLPCRHNRFSSAAPVFCHLCSRVFLLIPPSGLCADCFVFLSPCSTSASACDCTPHPFFSNRLLQQHPYPVREFQPHPGPCWDTGYVTCSRGTVLTSLNMISPLLFRIMSTRAKPPQPSARYSRAAVRRISSAFSAGIRAGTWI